MEWIQDKQEVEIVDLILRLRDKLVRLLSSGCEPWAGGPGLAIPVIDLHQVPILSYMPTFMQKTVVVLSFVACFKIQMR